jgi:hypothetical protein
LGYNKNTQNFAASFVNGTAELGLFITKKGLACQKISGTRNHACGNQPLAELSKILFPSMHLKFGLMKNIVKAVNQEAVALT